MIYYTNSDKETEAVGEQFGRTVKDGTVVAMGPHTELYDTCPSYRKMVDLQRLEEEGGEHNG